MSSPVFLLASERSGTNLLRRRLSESQNVIYGPSPLHLLKHLFFAEPYYGDLNDDACFKTIVGDALGLAYNHFSPWDEHISVDEVLASYEEFAGCVRNVVGLMHVIYMLYVTRKGYTTYFCKDNNLFDYIDPLLRAIPDAKFVYLYRDPRDVILSQLKRPTQIPSIAYLSEIWRDEQLKCIKGVQDLTKDNKIYSVSYERLIFEENIVLDEIISFIDLGVSGYALEDIFFSERTDVAEWKNLNKKTLSNNYNKFKVQLSRRQISDIESITWNQLVWLGYKPENNERPVIKTYQKILEKLYGYVRFYVKKLISKRRITDGQIMRAKYIHEIRKKYM